jgi:hypothetical protein
VGCLVTAVDGTGRGTITVSASLAEERRTAVFLCDVERGVIAVVGQIEKEGPEAGGLLAGFRGRAAATGLVEVPELALGLLAGCLTVSRPADSRLARDWLEQTLGIGFELRPLPTPSIEFDLPPLDPAEAHVRAAEIVDACPGWLDCSRLTSELAKEILLREGRTTSDPVRDSGAFRFLFQHRVMHRLELYRRMLLWMGWFWTYGDEPELARAARVLAGQLSDEQYAVPSHPFAVVLMARSLDAAGAELGTRAEPRSDSRHRGGQGGGCTVP